MPLITFSHRGKTGRLLWIAGTVILLDQITKYLVRRYLPMYDVLPVVPGFLNLTHIQNPGGAFGLLARQSPWLRRAVFIVASAGAAVLILVFYRRTPYDRPMLAAAFAMIFGGAIGNLVDRLRFGSVVDFLDVYVGRAHWPAFNVADSAISIGIAIFVWHILFHRIPE